MSNKKRRFKKCHSDDYSVEVEEETPTNRSEESAYTSDEEPIHHILTNRKVDRSKPDECVFMTPSYPENDVIGFEEPQTALKKYKVYLNRPVRIYCDGIYDLFHYGHARSLQQAKNLFPDTILIVGVPSDKITLSLKGKTVLSDEERIESLRHCKYVDEIIQNAPWVLSKEFLDRYEIDYVAHDDAPYAGQCSSDIYASIKAMGRFLPTKRTIGISTTGIITNIVRDYDRYVRRNLERGISAKELNIGLFKKLDYEMQKGIDMIGENMRNELVKIRGEIRIAFGYWEKMSNVWVNSFIERFGKNKFWNKIAEKVRMKRVK